MALKDDLEKDATSILKSAWSTRQGTVVPDETSVTLGNDGIKLTATIFYADLSASTKLVDNFKKEFAAEIYKIFLSCAGRIIKSHGGVITAYDGDRVMAVFIGSSKNTSAVKAALQLNWACKNILQPAINNQYNTTYVLKHVVGIDTSELLVANAGVRGSRDLVWVGRAANWAAKLCGLGDTHPTWITKAIYDNVHESAKFSKGKDMWEARTWTSMNNTSIYRSNYWWEL